MTEPDPRDPRLDATYRDAATEEPSPASDERIRAAARRAVAAGPQSLESRARAEAQRSWIARWRVPMSIAASVVVAVTLSYMVQDEAIQKSPIDGLPRSASSPAAAVAPADEAKAPVPATTPTPDPALAELAAKVEAARAAATAAQPANLHQRATTEQAPPEPTSAAKALAGADAPAANGMLAKESERRQAASDAGPAASPPSPPQAIGAPREMQAAPAAAAQAPPPAPVPMAKPAPARGLPESAGRDRALADRPDRMERGATSASAEQKVRTPEEWVEDLRRLKASGRTDELVKELVEFRKRFPDYKLPADLLP